MGVFSSYIVRYAKTYNLHVIAHPRTTLPVTSKVSSSSYAGLWEEKGILYYRAMEAIELIAGFPKRKRGSCAI
jgi:hypothetical protein